MSCKKTSGCGCVLQIAAAVLAKCEGDAGRTEGATKGASVAKAACGPSKAVAKPARKKEQPVAVAASASSDVAVPAAGRKRLRREL